MPLHVENPLDLIGLGLRAGMRILSLEASVPFSRLMTTFNMQQARHTKTVFASKAAGGWGREGPSDEPLVCVLFKILLRMAQRVWAALAIPI